MKLKLPKLTVKHNIAIMLISGVVLGILLVSIFGFGLAFAIEGFGGGWEVRTNLNSVYIGGDVKEWYTASTAPLGDIPWGPKNVQFDPTPSDTYPKWDVVREPDIIVSVDDPIHTSEDRNHNLIKNDDGSKVISSPLSEYVREIPRTVGGEQRFYYHHVYAYTVTVKTEADQEVLLAFQSNMETKGEEGVALYFTIRTKFAIDPWQIVGDIITDEDTGETFRVSTAWAGVMAASYEIVDAGFTDRVMQAKLDLEGRDAVLAIVTTGWDWTKPQEHDACSMWTESMTPANNEVPLNPQYIENVPRVVYVDTSGMLWAGAAQPWFNIATGYDLYMQFTVRMDVLTCAGFTPVSGTDPLPDPPDDLTEGPAPFLYPLFYSLGEWWGANWWIVGVVLIIIVVFLGLMFFSRIIALVKAVRSNK
jgi:hypothetical protein